ncbi:uncharacterized protein [Montipora foliosa]|uniref:uncharacterized protein isoform X2 n=1 Tax=Montipora foliosa TaxID=591990 RepID=UPI0035F1843E
MAERERSAHVGRPRLPGTAKYIRLRESVFNLWRERKESHGKLTDSEFAEVLLHRSHGRDVRDPVASGDRSFQVSTTQDVDLIPLCSTPARGMPDGQPFNLSANFSNSDVDVTGVTTVNRSVLPVVQNSILLSSNSSFNALDGNPFSVFEPEEEDDNDDIDDDDDDVVSVGSDKSADDPDIYGFFTEDHHFTNRMCPVIEQFRRISDSEDSEDDSDFVGFIDCDEDMDATQIDDHTKLLCEDMDISVDDERTLTMIQDMDASDVIQESLPLLVQEHSIEAGSSQGIVFEGATLQGSGSELPGLHAEQSKKVEDNKENILAALQSSLNDLTSIGEELRDFAMLHQRSRHIVSVEKLLELAGSKCAFEKHCAAPVIEEVWGKINELVKKAFKHFQGVCLCGDGRNDSPGHSARYCVYTIMEHFTNVVVDFEVVDKRETGGNSTTMEKEALRRLLERMATVFPFGELTTDASPSIIKLVRDLKEKFPQLMELFHSLDIWHKAKKLNKALHQAAKIKGCSDLQEWTDCIVNHFWYCSQDCNGSEEQLKETWVGVLHHVCGEHTWATGQCKHDPLGDESAKKYLEKNSKAMAALRKIVLDPKWLSSLHFYVNFRHTSVLESYNAMMTKYAPKRMAFEYPYFIMRVMIAAIDHNMHLNRKPKLTKEGKQQGHRKYSKRSQKFHAEVVKEEKQYSYFPFLVCKMLHRRSVYEGSFTLPSDRNSFDPKQIAPTIGMKEPPPTEELLKGPSRFDKKIHLKTDIQQLMPI